MFITSTQFSKQAIKVKGHIVLVNKHQPAAHHHNDGQPVVMTTEIVWAPKLNVRQIKIQQDFSSWFHLKVLSETFGCGQ